MVQSIKGFFCFEFHPQSYWKYFQYYIVIQIFSFNSILFEPKTKLPNQVKLVQIPDTHGSFICLSVADGGQTLLCVSW